MLQLGLEADHVVERAERVVLAQLHHGMGPPSGARVGQADRLHRPEAQGLGAARGHHLDRQAALEVGGALPLLELGLLAGQQGGDEGLVLRLVERAVDVVGAVAARADLVVARLEPGLLQVDAVAIDDRRDGVEEGQVLLAGEGADRLRERRRRQRAGGDDDVVPVLRRQAGHLAAFDGHERLGFQRGLNGGGKAVAIDRQRAAGRHLVLVGRAQDQGVQPPHLLVQQADGVGLGIVGAEGVGADQFGQPVGLVRLGRSQRPHLVQHDGQSPAGDLPSGLAAGETAADDVDGQGRGGRCLAHAPSHRTKPARSQGMLPSWAGRCFLAPAREEPGGALE